MQDQVSETGSTPGTNRFHPKSWPNWTWIPIVVAAIALVSWGVWAWVDSRRDVEDPARDAVLYTKELHLVRHHYETIIPITKAGKGDQLEFLLIAPAVVDGYVDLGKARFEQGKNKEIVIALPEPEISDVQIDINETREYTTRKRPLRLELPGNTKYAEAYEAIRSAISDSRKEVATRALNNGIQKETRRRAERYLRNLFGSLGYKVTFEDIETPVPAGKQEEKFQQQLEEFLSSGPDQDRRLKLVELLLKK